jgi:hypothetical protein
VPADGDKPKKPQRKPFLLRLSPELMAELKGWAGHEYRSLNGHIEYLLREAVRRRKGQPPDASDDPQGGSEDQP